MTLLPFKGNGYVKRKKDTYGSLQETGCVLDRLLRQWASQAEGRDCRGQVSG
jgi:hypothetical protein